MSEQKKAPKIEDSVILSAIEKVKEKGFDINPYTVSDEARVFPSDIFRAPELMKIILDAREEADRWHFQPSKSEADIKFNTLEFDLTKLREENERLAAQVGELEEKLTAPEEVRQNQTEKSELSEKPDNAPDSFSLGGDFNEQFKDLLQMESESEVEELEKQLAEAREELATLQEEILRIKDDSKDMSHSVMGLEKVNEALNLRLREVENENREMKQNAEKQALEKPPVEASSDLTDRLNLFEDENARLITRIQELENAAEQKEIAEANEPAANPDLEAYAAELEQRIADTEAKQAEMQEEMDMLVTQLQNSWHTGYQKGHADGKAEGIEEGLNAAPQQIQIEPASLNYDSTAPIQAQSFQAPDLSMMQNAGASSNEYDALKDMKWKDVETVYQMGGQQHAPQGGYYPEAASPNDLNAPQQAYVPQESYEQHDGGYDFGGGHQNYDEQENVQDLPYNPYGQGEYATEQQGEYQDAYPEQPQYGYDQNQGPIQHQEQYQGQYQEQPIMESVDFAEQGEIDFDQMDIFEDIEELERLGRIELPDDIIPIDHSAKSQSSQDQLRELVQHKIQHAQEHVTGESPRLAGKATAEQVAAAAEAAKGINKFVGQRGAHANSEAAQSATNLPVVRHVPPEIRKACQILGLAPEQLTKETISDSWKKAITAPGVHPDQGGDTEIATSINLAKATLLKYMDQTAPKLGKKFGAQGAGGTNRFAGKRKPDEQETGKKDPE